MADRPRCQTVPVSQPLKWKDWIVHVLVNNPGRIFDPGERKAWADAYWKLNPRLEARQWRRTGMQTAGAKAEVA
jgi:hypothetical protein